VFTRTFGRRYRSVILLDHPGAEDLKGGASLVKTAKTNAVRLLDRLGVRYELREYDVDPDDLAAETVARKVGLPPEQVFKTLVARGDKHGVCLAVVPGDCELDLKAMARATGDKKTDTVPLKEVEPLTGYIRGGVTALACKKPYPVYLDETAALFDVISVSAGVRGVQVLLAPDDYVRAVGAKIAGIAKDKRP
jgi:Cys-tRNA(Pro)/Cys-tRNA(Cys) deacylase